MRFFSRTLSVLFLLLITHLPAGKAGYSLFITSPALASEEFQSDYQVRYEIKEDGRTVVHQAVALTNKLSSLYASQYSLTISTGRIENIRANDAEGPLTIETTQTGEATVVDLFFNQQVVGQGKTLNFDLEYELLDVARKNGQVWEIFIPKLAEGESIHDYRLTLAVPLNFGQPAFISPQPAKQEEKNNLQFYYFTKTQVLASGINAAFGQFQIFDFVLNYHLENPNLTAGETEIALPPDTAFQRVSYVNIEPVPRGIAYDPDGNWLAKYRLGSQEKLNIIVVGKAKVFTQPQKEFLLPAQGGLNENLLPQKYWEVDHPLIQITAGNLKTPQEVYQFVVKTLDYDFSRVEEGAQRLGALTALKNPHQAICTEFTDLFIALARAAGIPAREINGYAHTTNDRLRPLGLVSDILHAWPEYWDKEKQIWRPIDPTWEKTTGGIDYFYKSDLNRLAFAIHGQDSQTPYPAGSYKLEGGLGKDVQVTFGQYEADYGPEYTIEFDLPSEVFSQISRKGKIVVKNTGSEAIYNLKLEFKPDNLILVAPATGEETIPALLPFSQVEIPVELQGRSWLGSDRALVTILAGHQEYRSVIKTGSLIKQLVLPPILIIALALAAFFMLKRKQKHAR